MSMRPVRTISLVFAALLVGGTASACGSAGGSASDGDSSSAGASGSASASPSATPSGSADLASQAWLLRFESYSGADGEATTARYVTYTPSTGAASVVKLPTVPVSEAGSTGLLLLVDASHHWALNDSQPAAELRKDGKITVYNLAAGGKEKTIDVRAAAGGAPLKTQWASFDPEVPGLMRIVSGNDVWKLDLGTGQAQQEGTLPPLPDGWLYGGGFSVTTGEPYIEDGGSFQTNPSGNGEDAKPTITRGGGTVLTYDGTDKMFGERPDPGCPVALGFVAADKTTWAFCVTDGGGLSTKRLADGDTTWQDVGTPAAAVAPTDGDPVFALPPVPTA